MKNYLTLSILLLISSCCVAQDTFREQLNITDDKNGLFAATFDSENNYYFEYHDNNDTNPTTTILKTNCDLDIIEIGESLQIRNKSVSKFFFMEVVNEKLLIGTNLINNEKLYFLTAELDLSNFTLTDSIELINGLRFVVPDTNFKTDANNNFYTIGSAESNGAIESNHYLEIDQFGKVVSFKTIDGMNSRVTSVDKSNSTDYTIVNIFPETALLLNDQLEILDEFEARYYAENISAGFNAYSCEHIDSSTFRTFNVGFFPNQYSSSVADYTIEDNLISLDTLISTHDFAEDSNSVAWSVMDKDKEGNTYMAYQERYNPFNDMVDPNHLFLIKLDSELQTLYQYDFYDGGEYIFSDAMVDHSGNLVCTGVSFQLENPLTYQNFIIKINDTGEVLTSIGSKIVTKTDLNIFPNPCTDYLTISNIKQFHEGSFSIYANNGQLMISGILNESLTNKIDTSFLLPGIYTVRVISEGQSIVQKIIKM